MNKQLVAERLAAKYGVRVSVGIHKGFRPKLDEDGNPIPGVEEPFDEGEKFTRADNGPVDQKDIDEAEAEVLQEFPTGDKPPLDPADINNLGKTLKAFGLLIAQYTSKTPAQVRSDFMAIYRGL